MRLKIRNKSIYADLSLFLVAIIWGSGFVIIKNALDYIHPIYILALRFVISFILMSIIFFKKVKTINKEDLKAGSIIGIFLFLAFLVQTIGLKYTTVSKQAFITAGNVVVVPFLYWFITKTKPGKYEIIAAFSCFIGIGILSIEKNFTIGIGDSLTMLCAIFFACHIVTIDIFSKKHDPIILTIIQFGVSALLSFLVAFLFKINLGTMNREVTISILYLAIVSTIIAFGVQNVAQKYTSSTHTAIILSMESVFGSIFSVLILKETFTLKLFVGSLIVLLSVITAETKWDFLKNKISNT